MGQSISKDADGCKYVFMMSISVCKTAPYREMVLQIPSIGSQFKKIGCGCQEMLVRANYEAKIVGMENRMKSTQSTCAANFAKWTLHFQEEYFFGGLHYQAHAIRIAKEIKNQCRNSGSILTPEKAQEHKKKSLTAVMAKNSAAIRKYEAEVQTTEGKLIKLQKETTQCKASLPKKSEFSANEPLFPVLLQALEAIRVVPAGTAKTQVMLQAGGIGCERGGATGTFTPMWLMVGRKPTTTN